MLARDFEVACELRADFTTLLPAFPTRLDGSEPYRIIEVRSFYVARYALSAHQFRVLCEQFDIVLTLDTDRISACIKWEENVGRIIHRF